MKIQGILIVLICTVLLSTSSFAVDMAAGEALAGKSGCLVCHAVDHKVVGPSYQDIAAKYKDKAGAQEMLIQNVKKGVVGNWGKIPMPANSPRVADDDIKTLVEWVLAH